jgi:hypothetical protein
VRAVVVALVLAVFARPADACRCAGSSDGDDFAISAVVVVANVVSRAKAPDKRDVVLVLEVESKWKGDVTKQLKVTTRRAGSACGRPEIKGRWIVFAQRSGKALVTHLCDSSREATAGAIDEMTKQFGAPTKV